MMKRGSMRVAIPAEMREELEGDIFMQWCILWDDWGYQCNGRIEWNHAFKYVGIRRNERWAILPMCRYHHDKEAQYRTYIDKFLRKRIKHFNATNDFKEKYPRSTLLI